MFVLFWKLVKTWQQVNRHCWLDHHRNDGLCLQVPKQFKWQCPWLCGGDATGTRHVSWVSSWWWWWWWWWWLEVLAPLHWVFSYLGLILPVVGDRWSISPSVYSIVLFCQLLLAIVNRCLLNVLQFVAWFSLSAHTKKTQKVLLVLGSSCLAKKTWSKRTNNKKRRVRCWIMITFRTSYPWTDQ